MNHDAQLSVDASGGQHIIGALMLGRWNDLYWAKWNNSYIYSTEGIVWIQYSESKELTRDAKLVEQDIRQYRLEQALGHTGRRTAEQKRNLNRGRARRRARRKR